MRGGSAAALLLLGAPANRGSANGGRHQRRRFWFPLQVQVSTDQCCPSETIAGWCFALNKIQQKAKLKQRHARGFTSWGQFMAMLFCQLGRAHSLREICGGLACCEGQLKHLGVPVAPKKSTLAYANEHRPWQLYQTVFEQTLFKCQELVQSQGGRKKFRFKNKLMSLDGSIIDLSVSMFDWAKFRRTKGAIKLHLLLDHDGYLPSFAVVTEGKTSEIKVARTLRFAPGTILAIDRGYNDYEWFRELTQEEVYFVTRMKEKAVYEVKEELQVPQNSNVVRDQIICFPRLQREGEEPVLFRRVEIWDAEKQVPLVFLSNLLGFGATTIAAIYKDRWAGGIVFQGAEADLQNQDVCGDQRQCGEDPGLDGADSDAGAEVPAVEITVFLVVVDTGGSAATAIVLLSRFVGVAGRSFSGPAGSGRGTRRCATTCDLVVGEIGRQKNEANAVRLISGDL